MTWCHTKQSFHGSFAPRDAARPRGTSLVKATPLFLLSLTLATVLDLQEAENTKSLERAEIALKAKAALYERMRYVCHPLSVSLMSDLN